MSSLVKSEFKKDLESLKEKVNEQNDGISTAKRISSGIVAIAQKSVTQANASKSIDEKINILVSGLQEAVSFSEKESADLKERVLKLRDKIEYLEEMVDKIDRLLDEEKKSNSSVKEEEV